MSLFRLDASIRVEGSHSRAIADIVEHEWSIAHPGEPIARRSIGVEPLPSSAWAAAVAGSRIPEGSRTPAQSEAVALAGTLVDELVAADALIFAVPLYNFGVSQHFKTWVDLAITDLRLAPAAGPLLDAKPAVLVVTRGGSYGPGTPREGWDHATGWMARILADVWHLELSVLETELTQVGVNPALDGLRELAAQRHHESEQRARELGRRLASTPSSPSPARAA